MNQTLVLFGLPTTPLELTAFALSIACVVLNIRQNHWGWLFAILGSILYGVVFYDSRLYGDMGLQVVFAVVSVWGWYQWLHGGEQHSTLKVSWLNDRQLSVATVSWLAGFGVLAWFLGRYTDTDVPLPDAFLTAGSLVGQVLLSRKKVENWIVWIIVDVLYVGLYISKHLHLTAILYAVFVVLAVLGLREWKKRA